jgi:hypothetical protein
MPHRRLAGLFLMLVMLQIVFAPAAYACVSHHTPAAHCHDPVAGSVSGGATVQTESVAQVSGVQSHDSHHTQACCAASDACGGLFFPASAPALCASVVQAPFTPAQPGVPTVRRAAPDSPPPKI